MTIGEKIKYARLQAGMSQKTLGNKLGISYQCIAQWENNLRRPKLENILKLAAALEIAPSDLDDSIAGTAQMSPARDVSVDRIQIVLGEERANRLCQSLNALNEQGKNTAIQRVEELTEISRYTKDREDKV